MHRHIAATGGWGNADAAQKAVRGQLAKKKQFNTVQISNLVNAVAQGGNSRSLVTTLERLEAEQDELTRQLTVIEAEIAQATVKRPTAVQVQRVWGETLSNWKNFSEQERTDALGALVLTSQMGAVLHEVTNYPDLYLRGFAVPRSSRKGVSLRQTSRGDAVEHSTD